MSLFDREDFVTNEISMSNLADALLPYLRTHHCLYETPCESKFSEELISRALNDIGHPNVYRFSHNPKYDIPLDGGNNLIQIKSGKIASTCNKMKVSSHRLTGPETLDEKLHYLESNKPDVFIFLSTDGKFRKRKRYYLGCMNPDKLSYRGDWKQAKNGDYLLTVNDIKMSITRKMSDQLWYYIPLTKLDFLEAIDL